MRDWLGNLLRRIAALLSPSTAGGRDEEAPYVARVLTIAAVALVLPIAGLAIYASSGTAPPVTPPIDDLWRRIAAATLAPAGPMAIGSLVGFLFGIPKSAQREPHATGAQSDTARSTGTDRLEELSEWGVKLLLGASLTQLGWLRTAFEGTAERLSLALGAQPSAHAVAWTALGYFLAWGFFAGFLATRLWLLGELRRVDRIQNLESRLNTEQVRREEADELAKSAAAKLTAVADASVGGLEAAVVTRAGPDPVKTRKAIESLVFSALYQAPPEGFRKAIAIADEYPAKHGEETESNADLNAYLACAHGQAHAYEKTHAARTDVVGHHRERALAAASAAVAGSAGTRELLRAYLRARPGEIDDDLASLAGDPEFEKLLGEPTP